MHNLCKLIAFKNARSNVFMFSFVDLSWDKIRYNNKLFAKHIYIFMNKKKHFPEKWLICIIYAYYRLMRIDMSCLFGLIFCICLKEHLYQIRQLY